MAMLATQNQKKSRSSVYLLHVRVDSTSKEKLLNTVFHIVSRSAYNTLFTIFTPNPEQIVLAQANDHFRSILNQSSLNLPDGVGLLWADRWLSKRTGQLPTLKNRVTGVDSMQALVRMLYTSNTRIFLLGGSGGSAQRAAEQLITEGAQSLRNTSIASLRNLTAFDQGSPTIHRESKAELERVLAAIKQHRTKVLFVAYGAPQQETWVMANRERLVEAGVRVAMVVGGAFEILAGNASRAPLKWQKIGLEWLWRLVHEPWRWRRQLRLVEFVGMVMAQAVKRVKE